MRIVKCIVMIAAVVVLSGCAVVNTMGDYPINKVKVGMTQDEARKIFKGYYMTVAAASLDTNGRSQETWRYVNDNFEYLLRFSDGILVGWDSGYIIDPNYYYWMENHNKQHENSNQ